MTPPNGYTFYHSGRAARSIDSKKYRYSDTNSRPTRVLVNLYDHLYGRGMRHERFVKILDQWSRKH